MCSDRGRSLAVLILAGLLSAALAGCSHAPQDSVPPAAPGAVAKPGAPAPGYHTAPPSTFQGRH